MPFTLAHPAIVLPLLSRTRRWLSVTGLVLGSMAPDFEYFLRLRAYGNYGHTWFGLLWFDLPLGLLAAGLFHGLIKRPLVRSLPLFLRKRLSRPADKPWPLRQLWSLRVILAVLLGSLSHLFLDAFTHDNTFFVDRFPQLQEQIGPMRVYRWLQYISSVLGLLAIAWFFWKLPLRPRIVKAASKVQRLYWTMNGLLAASFWALFLLVNEKDERWLLVSVVVTGISAVCLAQLLTALLMRRYFLPSQQARAARMLTREISHQLTEQQAHS